MGTHEGGTPLNEQRFGPTNRFRWLCDEHIPPECDLRRAGWLLEHPREPSREIVGVLSGRDLDQRIFADLVEAIPEDTRRLVILTAIEDTDQRSALLLAGFGDAVSSSISLTELSARANRVASFARSLPRHRRIGPLVLDLLAREGYGREIPLNLNPREFALIWRLADTPNICVSKSTLIRDVWRMGFVPETNSIAVHMSRLRRKLAFAGLDRLIETAAEGGYRLLAPCDSSTRAREDLWPGVRPDLSLSTLSSPVIETIHLQHYAKDTLGMPSAE